MGAISLIVFLVWPFGALLFSLKNYSKNWTKNIIWAFVVFYGFTFVLSNDTMDANRLKEKFEFFKYADFNLVEVVKYFFINNEEGVDVIQPIILYVTSLFTQDFQVLMATLAFILGFFYSRNICYLLDRRTEKINLYSFLIVWLFIFVIGFWQINGFRFWTASHIFFYALIPYFYEGRKNRLWLLPVVSLLHFSYLLPIVVFLIYFFVKERVKFIFYIFLLSFFVGVLSPEAIGEMLIKFLPKSFENKVSVYTSSSYVEEVASEESSMSAILRTLMFHIINVYFIVLYYYYRHTIKRDPYLFNLFVFSILIMTTGNFASVIPSGQRFLIVSSLFFLSFLFFYIQTIGLDKRLRLLFQLGAPFLFLASLGYIRIGFNTINELAIIGNPLVLFLVDSSKALIQLF